MTEVDNLKTMISNLNSLRGDNEVSSNKRSKKLEVRKQEFFNFFKELATETHNYGWSIKCKIFIKDGTASFKPFIIHFTPFEKDDFILVGYWEEKESKGDFNYSFNPDASDISKQYGTLTIPAFDFVFLQVLDKEKDIRELIINQFNEDLKRRIKFEIEIDTLYKKYS